MISPAQMEYLAQEIRRLYADAETAVLERIAKRIVKGINATDWQQRKLTELRLIREEIEKIISALNSGIPVTLNEILMQTYLSGAASADSDLKALGITLGSVETVEIFGPIHRRAVSSLVSATTQSIQNAHIQVLRNSIDIYRAVIAESVRTGVVGVETRRETAQRALNRFADKGVGGFVDKRGREWDLASYTEMATRSAIGRAAINGHLDRMSAHGYDLVIVSDHTEECPLCRPWEGKILSQSGNTPGYPTVEQARNAGLFHPSCAHTIGAYIEGLTQPVTPKHDAERYEIRQQQRYMERQVRQWKRRQAVAILDDDKRRSSGKVREWQAKLREFTAEHDRRRKYERESIERGR